MLQREIRESFDRHFGATPLEERVADIERQVCKLSRHVDTLSLREAAGDLLCSLVQLANENDWEADQLVSETLRRIESRHETYAEFGRRLRVGVLSGAFDPVHDGHVELSEIALESGYVDEIWWVPCYSHVAGQAMADPQHRLAMCELAAAKHDAISVVDLDIRHRLLGNTYQLARRLLADDSVSSRYVLHFLIRRDNAEAMSTWDNFESLQRLVPAIVISRQNESTPEVERWYCKSPHRFLGQRLQFDATSSAIRQSLAEGDEAVAEKLPASVFDYLRDHDLYRFTARREPLRAKDRRRVAAMIGSFDPPTSAQVELVDRLLRSGFDAVKILPAAHVRGGLVIEHAEPVHRAALIDLTFGGHPAVEIDFRGLEDERAVAPATLLQSFDEDDLWFVVHQDTIASDANVRDVRNAWNRGERLWREAGFVVVTESDDPPPDDLPPRHERIVLRNLRHPHQLRQQLADGVDVSDVLPEVAERYIDRHRLFQSVRPQMQLPLQFENPQIRLVYDERNAKAARLADRYRRWEGPDAEVIIVIGGDGTMLHAIRNFWRLRLPFIGINAGHLGFLMNPDPFPSLEKLDVVSYRMPMLRAVVKSAAGELQKHLAFSDAWIERQTGQAAWFELTVDGESRVPKVVGDGLLVATPSGSSSYARAMGATPVPLDTQSLTIAGSNIFRPRFWQPLMMPADATIQINTLDHTGKRPVQAFVDGVPAGQVESMQVRRSHVAAVELAFHRTSDLATKLLASLLPNESDRF